MSETLEFVPSEMQAEAIKLCLDRSKRIVSVTGAAGTGKTSIIKAVFKELQDAGVTVALAAPTGKAAKRIREATGIQAQTVHKLLEYSRPGERDEKTGKPMTDTVPKRDHTNPLWQMVVIVDEYTMINHELNRNIIDALQRGAVLRCFGDINQLPPIEPHALQTTTQTPFEEHLSRKDAVVTLDKVFRQGEDSGVLTAATAIRAGRMPARSADFRMVMTDQPVRKLEEFVMDQQDAGIDYSKVENQIITPTKKRWIGTYELNTVLKNIFNPRPLDEMQMPRHKWESDIVMRVGVGDKVVCTENTYDMRDYGTRYAMWEDDGSPVSHSFIPTPDNKVMLNGETGVVVAVYPDGAMEIDFGDRLVEVPASYEEYWAAKGIIIQREPGVAIDLAYALTTHKAQGSEYDHVVYVMNKSIFFMLSRENLYTGVTRAKKTATLIADQSSIGTAVRVTEKSKAEAARRKAASKKMVR